MDKWQRCDNNICWKGDGVELELRGEGVQLADEGLKSVCRNHKVKVDIADAIVNEWKEL